VPGSGKYAFQSAPNLHLHDSLPTTNRRVQRSLQLSALSANDNAKAKEIAAWKEEVVSKWDSIEVVSYDKCEELLQATIESGKEYTITYVIDEKGLNDAIGLELVYLYCRRR